MILLITLQYYKVLFITQTCSAQTQNSLQARLGAPLPRMEDPTQKLSGGGGGGGAGGEAGEGGPGRGHELIVQSRRVSPRLRQPIIRRCCSSCQTIQVNMI